ncbi:riboflavin kinase [Ramaria rubella]|nr:riboflavin kinase [Ramaria rubella]
MVTARPLIIGPSTGLEAPYPLQMEGKVIHGFGRGSKELGIPTANLPVDDNLTPWIANIEPGVYFGWASLRLPPSHPNQPTTSSAPHHGPGDNTGRSAEAHVLHEFGADFYGVEMRLLVIREEKDYAGVEELIEDIRVDCEVARKSLDREAWALRETGKGTLDGSWLVR